MQIAANSVCLQWLLRFWAVLSTAWADSGCRRLVNRWGRTLILWLDNSLLWRLFWRRGRIPASWTQTRLYRILDSLVSLPARLLSGLHSRARPLWDGSLLLQTAARLGLATPCLVGLLLLFCLIVEHNVWNNLYALLGVLLILALFFAGSTLRPQQRLDLSAAGPYLILYMAVACFCTILSMDVGLSLRFLAFHLTAFLLLILVVSSVDSYQSLHLMTVLAVAGITVGALYGCYQAYMGIVPIPGQQDVLLNAGMPGRADAFYDNSNVFAGLLILLTPLNFALFLNARSRPGRLAALFSLAVCVIALSQTYSRAGYLGLTVSVAVFIAFFNWRLLPILGLMGLACLPLLPQTVYNRILTIGNSADSSLNYRFAIYESTFYLLQRRGLLGVGLGSEVLQQAFLQYPPMSNGAYPVHTHNTYLQVWAETGLPGLLSFAATLIHQFKEAVFSHRAGSDHRVRYLMAAAVSGLCGNLLMGVAEYTWFYPRNMFLFWFLFGIISACIKLAKKEACA